MTIRQSLNEKVLSLNLENLSETEHEWLHFINGLFMWSSIAQARRDLNRAKAA